MPRRKPDPADDPTETAIRHAGGIGDLERLAGIPSDREAREAFWLSFMHLPAATALDAGVVELKHRIRVAAHAAHAAAVRRRGARRRG